MTAARRLNRLRGSRLALLAVAAVATACAHGGSAPPPQHGGGRAAPTQDHLVRRPDFTQCELEGFIALAAARGAFAFHVSKEQALAATKVASTQAMIEDLYAAKESGAVRNHASFAERRFYACADARRLGIEKKPGGAAVCLAHLDIVFYLDAWREKGETQEEALAHFRRSFANSPRDIYPDALADALAPMVYRATTSDDDYELRRFVFESCLFPDEWKAWWESTRRDGG